MASRRSWPRCRSSAFLRHENLRAWLPWILLTVFVTVVSLGPVKSALNKTFAPQFPVPGLHLAVDKMPPVAAHAEPEAAQFTFNLLSATGTSLLIAGRSLRGAAGS